MVLQGEGRTLLASREFMLGEHLPSLQLIPRVGTPVPAFFAMLHAALIVLGICMSCTRSFACMSA